MGNAVSCKPKLNPRDEFDQLGRDYHTLCTHLSFFSPYTGIDINDVMTKTNNFFAKYSTRAYNRYHSTYPENLTHLANIFFSYHNQYCLKSLLSKHDILPSLLSDNVTLLTFYHLFHTDEITPFIIELAHKLIYIKAHAKTYIFSSTDGTYDKENQQSLTQFCDNLRFMSAMHPLLLSAYFDKQENDNNKNNGTNNNNNNNHNKDKSNTKFTTNSTSLKSKKRGSISINTTTTKSTTKHTSHINLSQQTTQQTRDFFSFLTSESINNPFSRDFYLYVLNLAILSVTPYNITPQRIYLILSIYQYLNTLNINCLMESTDRHVPFKPQDIPVLFSHFFRVFHLKQHDTPLFREVVRLFFIPPSFIQPIPVSVLVNNNENNNPTKKKNSVADITTTLAANMGTYNNLNTVNNNIVADNASLSPHYISPDGNDTKKATPKIATSPNNNGQFPLDNDNTNLGAQNNINNGHFGILFQHYKKNHNNYQNNIQQKLKAALYSPHFKLPKDFNILHIKHFLKTLPVFHYPLVEPENVSYITVNGNMNDVRFLSNIHRSPLHFFLTQPLTQQVNTILNSQYRLQRIQQLKNVNKSSNGNNASNTTGNTTPIPTKPLKKKDTPVLAQHESTGGDDDTDVDVKSDEPSKKKNSTRRNANNTFEPSNSGIVSKLSRFRHQSRSRKPSRVNDSDTDKNDKKSEKVDKNRNNRDNAGTEPTIETNNKGGIDSTLETSKKNNQPDGNVNTLDTTNQNTQNTTSNLPTPIQLHSPTVLLPPNDSKNAAVGNESATSLLLSPLTVSNYNEQDRRAKSTNVTPKSIHNNPSDHTTKGSSPEIDGGNTNAIALNTDQNEPKKQTDTNSNTTQPSQQSTQPDVKTVKAPAITVVIPSNFPPPTKNSPKSIDSPHNKPSTPTFNAQSTTVMPTGFLKQRSSSRRNLDVDITTQTIVYDPTKGVKTSILTYDFFLYLVELTVLEYIYKNSAHSQLPVSVHRNQCIDQIRTTLLLKMTPPLNPSQNSSITDKYGGATTLNNGLHHHAMHSSNITHNPNNIPGSSLANPNNTTSSVNPTVHQCTSHYITVVEALCNPVSNGLVNTDILRILLWFLQADCPILHNCTATAFYNNNKDVNMKAINTMISNVFGISPFPFLFLLRFGFTLYPSPSPLDPIIFNYMKDYTLQLTRSAQLMPIRRPMIKDTAQFGIIFAHFSFNSEDGTQQYPYIEYDDEDGTDNDTCHLNKKRDFRQFLINNNTDDRIYTNPYKPLCLTNTDRTLLGLPTPASSNNSTEGTTTKSKKSPQQERPSAQPIIYEQPLTNADMWYITRHHRYFDHSFLLRTFNPVLLCAVPLSNATVHFLTTILTTGLAQYYVSYDHVRSNTTWPFHPFLREYHSYMRFEFQTLFPLENYTIQYDLIAHELTCLNTSISMTLTSGIKNVNMLDLATKSNNIFPFLPTLNSFRQTTSLSPQILAQFQTFSYKPIQSGLCFQPGFNYDNTFKPNHNAHPNIYHHNLPTTPSHHMNYQSNLPHSTFSPLNYITSPYTVELNTTYIPHLRSVQAFFAEILSKYWRKHQFATHRLFPLANLLFLPAGGGANPTLHSSMFNGSVTNIKFYNLLSILPSEHLPFAYKHPDCLANPQRTTSAQLPQTSPGEDSHFSPHTPYIFPVQPYNLFESFGATPANVNNNATINTITTNTDQVGLWKNNTGNNPISTDPIRKTLLSMNIIPSLNNPNINIVVPEFTKPQQHFLHLRQHLYNTTYSLALQDPGTLTSHRDVIDPYSYIQSLQKQLHLHTLIFSTLFSTGLVWTLFYHTNQTVSYTKQHYDLPNQALKPPYATNTQSHSLVWLLLLNYYSLYYTLLHQQTIRGLNVAWNGGNDCIDVPMVMLNNQGYEIAGQGHVSGQNHNTGDILGQVDILNSDGASHGTILTTSVHALHNHQDENKSGNDTVGMINNSNKPNNIIVSGTKALPGHTPIAPVIVLPLQNNDKNMNEHTTTTTTTQTTSIVPIRSSSIPPFHSNRSNRATSVASMTRSRTNSTGPYGGQPLNPILTCTNHGATNPVIALPAHYTYGPALSTNEVDNDVDSSAKVTRSLVPVYTQPGALARMIEGYLTLVPPMHPNTFAPTLVGALYKIAEHTIIRLQHRLNEYKVLREQYEEELANSIIAYNSIHKTSSTTQYNRVNVSMRNNVVIGQANNDEWTHFTELIKPLASVRLTVFEYYCVILCFGALCYTDEFCFDEKTTKYIYSPPDQPLFFIQPTQDQRPMAKDDNIQFRSPSMLSQQLYEQQQKNQLEKDERLLHKPGSELKNKAYYNDICILQDLCPDHSNNTDVSVNYHALHAICMMDNVERAKMIKLWQNFNLTQFLYKMYEVSLITQAKLSQFIPQNCNVIDETSPMMKINDLGAIIKKNNSLSGTNPAIETFNTNNLTNYNFGTNTTLSKTISSNNINKNITNDTSSIASNQTNATDEVKSLDQNAGKSNNNYVVKPYPRLEECLEGIDNYIITPETSSLYTMKHQDLYQNRNSYKPQTKSMSKKSKLDQSMLTKSNPFVFDSTSGSTPVSPSRSSRKLVTPPRSRNNSATKDDHTNGQSLLAQPQLSTIVSITTDASNDLTLGTNISAQDSGRYSAIDSNAVDSNNRPVLEKFNNNSFANPTKEVKTTPVLRSALSGEHIPFVHLGQGQLVIGNNFGSDTKISFQPLDINNNVDDHKDNIDNVNSNQDDDTKTHFDSYHKPHNRSNDSIDNPYDDCPNSDQDDDDSDDDIDMSDYHLQSNFSLGLLSFAIEACVRPCYHDIMPLMKGLTYIHSDTRDSPGIVNNFNISKNDRSNKTTAQSRDQANKNITGTVDGVQSILTGTERNPNLRLSIILSDDEQKNFQKLANASSPKASESTHPSGSKDDGYHTDYELKSVVLCYPSKRLKSKIPKHVIALMCDATINPYTKPITAVNPRPMMATNHLPVVVSGNGQQSNNVTPQADTISDNSTTTVTSQPILCNINNTTAMVSTQTQTYSSVMYSLLNQNNAQNVQLPPYPPLNLPLSPSSYNNNTVISGTTTAPTVTQNNELTTTATTNTVPDTTLLPLLNTNLNNCTSGGFSDPTQQMLNFSQYGDVVIGAAIAATKKTFGTTSNPLPSAKDQSQPNSSRPPSATTTPLQTPLHQHKIDKDDVAGEGAKQKPSLQSSVREFFVGNTNNPIFSERKSSKKKSEQSNGHNDNNSSNTNDDKNIVTEKIPNSTTTTPSQQVEPKSPFNLTLHINDNDGTNEQNQSNQPQQQHQQQPTCHHPPLPPYSTITQSPHNRISSQKSPYILYLLVRAVLRRCPEPILMALLDSIPSHEQSSIVIGYTCQFGGMLHGLKLWDLVDIAMVWNYAPKFTQKLENLTIEYMYGTDSTK